MLSRKRQTPEPSQRQRRWPDHADDFRIAAIETAQDSTETLLLAQQQIDALLAVVSDPAIRERLLTLARQQAELVANQEYIQRMLTAARLGRA